MSFVYHLLRKAAFCFEPEEAHKLAIKALKLLPFSLCHRVKDERLQIKAAGLNFSHPLGLAAGFDKNAEIVVPLLNLGFSAVEVGTITPKPQQGNPRPRLFRLVEDEALINRMGFNNEGFAAIKTRLQNYNPSGIVGVNVGANKDSEDRLADYSAGIKYFYESADYLTVNISSPNTVGLRDLQHKEKLQELLAEIVAARQEMQESGAGFKPIFLKIAPDLSLKELEEIATLFQASGLDGLILCNTTVARFNLKDQNTAQEAGGLSGRPLFQRSTAVLAKMRQLLGKKACLIGVGGVHDAESFIEKIKAGADFVQLYTGFVYQGAKIAHSILSETLQQMEREKVAHISAYRDQSVTEWARYKEEKG